jgi:hypothetical protein
MSQTSGYAILRMPAALVEAYDLSMRSHAASELFQRLCQALKPLPPRTCYRGTSRFPIEPLPSTNPEILHAFTESGCDVDTERTARRRFLEILGDDIPDTDFDEALLPSLSAAQEVFALLKSPGEYEIVQVSREPFCNDADCLGFDVGYWGGDHYSIICDSAVRPLWHPPQPGCFDELACALVTVNEHFLFRKPEDAAEFRSYYRTQPWAETETRPDEFCIIQLSRPRS